MKKMNYIAVATMAFFTSCTGCVSRNNMLPANPTNNQTYVDNNGNSWVWNALMMRWALSGIGGNTYYYYPASGGGTGYFTNPSGARVTPPTTVSSGIIPKTNRTSTFRNHSSSPSRYSSTPSHSTSRHAAFGSTGRGHSSFGS